MQKFKVGDSVTWTSSSNGRTKKKEGKIIKIINAGELPSKKDFPSLYKISHGKLYLPWPRSHESYLIKVLVKNRKIIYWPIVKKLNFIR